MSERLLDLRGLRCPWPALRVGRALRDGREPVLAVADDPLAAREIGAVAAARGWTAEAVETAIGRGLRLHPVG
ncbi:sulfurtransferase TusA family protein [Sphingomonas sp.]|uniref:sulfurtransferase TusA family protein n=1 Tax=Sphingomonas sp. TaxID=28214 RepID=UPI003B005DD9